MNISEVDIVGVKDAFQKHSADESRGIKVLFKMDDSGILRIEKVNTTGFNSLEAFLVLNLF